MATLVDGGVYEVMRPAEDGGRAFECGGYAMGMVERYIAHASDRGQAYGLEPLEYCGPYGAFRSVWRRPQEGRPGDFFVERDGRITYLPIAYDTGIRVEHLAHRPETFIEIRGADLRELRESLGLSQRQLGEKLGVSPNTIARQERGERAIEHPLLLHRALRDLRRELAHGVGELR